MKIGVVQFPGSNCDQDIYHVCSSVLGLPTSYLWHKNESLAGSDLVILPGGFSYGDYLRCGAIARFSPVMKSVIAHAQAGGLVLGICNGFQILCESGLLPGALIRNRDLKFLCKDVHLRVESTSAPVSSLLREGSVLRIPIAHGEGNFQADPKTLADIEANGQVLFRYCSPDGTISACSNPNGSQNNIAGIANARKNVAGMMPHPERCAENDFANTDGLALFQGLVKTLQAAA